MADISICSFMTYHRCNTVGATSDPYLLRHFSFMLHNLLFFCVVFTGLLLVFLSIFFWSLYCLFFYELPLLIIVLLWHLQALLLTLSGHLSSPPIFSGVRIARPLVFCVMFCRSLFVPLVVLLKQICWPLRCLSFFDLRLLITTLVSSNFSYLHQCMPWRK
jgi:hypothetical protein